MNSVRVVTVLALAACGGAFGQSFECYATGALPTDPLLACEGVTSNNAGGGTGVTAFGSCGFPTSGSQYVVLVANGPVSVPFGGPFPRPAPGVATELRIPIPAGATMITLDWEFLNHETQPSSSFNDGMSIDVVDGMGALVQNLAYADTATLPGPCFFPMATEGGNSVATEVLPAGPNPLSAAIPAGSCSYVSVVVWNGGDNSVDSLGYVDNIRFNLAPFSSPFGPGSLQISYAAQSGCPGASSSYFLAVTLHQGTFPNGWLFGVDISQSELASELSIGGAFVGSSSGYNLGPFGGLPQVTFYAVILGFNAQGTLNFHSNAFSYAIP